MKPAGLKAFALRRSEWSEGCSYEKKTLALSAVYLGQLKRNKSARDLFINQAQSYQKVITHWIMSAKQESTRQSLLQKAIAAGGQQKRVRQ